MDTIKFKSKKVKMIAHRGLSGLEKENTCAAFVAAGNRSYYGIETDVHRTIDGKYVVFHDETTDRVCADAVSINIETTPFDQYKNISLPDVDGSTNRRDNVIPQLVDYIKICKKYGKIPVLEIKNRFEKQHLEEVVEIIKEQDYLDKVVFISFSFENCTDLRELAPTNDIQWLTGGVIDVDKIQELVKYNLNLDINYKSIDKTTIKKLHSLGLTVNVWTVNDKEIGEKLVKMGVDYITTNILE
jgi:glycerophosphoryl diester phosphodiesterase